MAYGLFYELKSRIQSAQAAQGARAKLAQAFPRVFGPNGILAPPPTAVQQQSRGWTGNRFQ